MQIRHPEKVNNPNNEIKKPKIKEKIIDNIEIETVIDRPLKRNCIFEYPFSKLGFKMYQPQL